ncbi:DUF1702 family protein [Winogradskya humida]|uniref:Enediyne biosynthesis protein n=1 Tax=Winogradskya humida TaxID=113566 RepID=A0ABQ4A1U8_9ACTN|nr:DUF1702 family protein [Actinoplanes humidus]GIE24593.1 enediyne biosynthesis protein [Actinoplanes humidus]
MPAAWLSLRRRLLTPANRETELARRGFRIKDPAARAVLETAGRTFLEGFGNAAGTATPDAAHTELERIQHPLRGFGYEGAAMAYALMAGLGIGGGLPAFLTGPAQRHTYMAHVGAGWAMARLPRLRWHRVTPHDPLLRWLALDGYGFHQAYFHTGRYVHQQYREPPGFWPAPWHGDYPGHVVDQGIGRALWFVEGADPAAVTTTIERFPADRRPDLYSGAGLAATYAAGATLEELAAFRDRAGEHRPAVAQGSAFAAKARVLAGNPTEATAQATGVLCGMTPGEAAAVTDEALQALQPGGARPTFAQWRDRISHRFAPSGRY